MSLQHGRVVNIALWEIFLHVVSGAVKNLFCCSVVVILLPPSCNKATLQLFCFKQVSAGRQRPFEPTEDHRGHGSRCEAIISSALVSFFYEKTCKI